MRVRGSGSGRAKQICGAAEVCVNTESPLIQQPFWDVVLILVPLRTKSEFDSVPSVLGSVPLSLFVYGFGLHSCVPRAQATATPSMPVSKFVT